MTKRVRDLSLLLSFAVAATPSSAFAQRIGLTVINENDWYLGRDDDGDTFPNDDDYTQGLRVSVVVPRAVLWGWPGVPDCSTHAHGACRMTAFVAGQNFYTPHEITSPDVLEHDRPYAAWLYAGIAAQVVSKRELRMLALDLGTTGRAAFGREAQTGWHRLWGFPEPRGWAHQVKPVPGLIGVIASWEHRLAFRTRTIGKNRLGAGLDPFYRVAAGNVFTSAAGGAVVRLGFNIQPRWTHRIPDTRRATKHEVPHWEVHAFGAAEGKLVGWNALLQYDTYTPRRLPPIERGVGDAEVGVLLGRGRIAGGFRWVWRSREYEGGRTSAFAGPFLALQP